MSSGPTQTAKLAPDDGDAGDLFGSSVALSMDGTTAIIGAYADDDPNGRLAGSAYVFEQSDGSWRQQAKLTPDDGDSKDVFGSSVAMTNDGTIAIIGARHDEDPNGETSGSAYVFGKDQSPKQTTARKPENTGQETIVSTNAQAESTTVATQNGSDATGRTPGFGVLGVLMGLTGAGFLRWRDTVDSDR